MKAFIVRFLCNALVDVVIVSAVAYWMNSLGMAEFFWYFALAFFGVIAVRVAVGLRNVVARILFYFLDHKRLHADFRRVARIKGWPKNYDVPAHFVDYYNAALRDPDIAPDTLASIAEVNGHLSSAMRSGFILGFSADMAIDGALLDYLAD